MRAFSLLFAMGLAVAAQGQTPPAAMPPYLDCGLVPGWEQTGPARSYAADNLFEYKDGAAEGYLQFDFARMQGVDCKQGAVVLSIDVSEMGSEEMAWGMLAANRDPKEPVAPIGMGAQVLPQSLLFAKGKYFVEIVENDGNPAGNVAEALKAFAAKIEPLLAGRTAVPDAVSWFPAEHRTEVRLVPESVLGVRLLKRGYVARYERGQAFAVVEETPQAAAETMKKLAARYAGVSAVQVGDEAFAGKVQYLDGICIFRKGRIVAGYTNETDAAAAVALAAGLAGHLPAR